MMKPIKGLLIVLLLLAVVFAFSAPALAAFGSQGGANGEGGIQVNPNAPGTKYEGPLTIYYTEDPNNSGMYIMHFFMRLRKGWTLYAFSGVKENIADDVIEQQTAIEDFFNTKVIPILYTQPYPPAALKSVDQIVNDATIGGQCCGGMNFTIMDVVIAVQD